MPKEYNYDGATFDAAVLSQMMGDEVIETPVAEIDTLVKTRDAGAALILTAYRRSVLGTKG